MDREKLAERKIIRECTICGFTTTERIVICPEDGSALLTHKPDPFIGTFIADRFEVLELIGSGGMGNVYKARQKTLERLVALKILHSEKLHSQSSVLRFQQEAKAAASLSHPNIVGFFDYGLTDDNVPFIAMDYVEGVSLDEEFKNGPLPVERALNIFTQTCDALAHAHDKGVIHRDIKPSNLMLLKDEDGGDMVKILDFGIAKMMPSGAEGQNLTLTVTGEVFGSPQYMSPEQCSGKPTDARSDMYSLGCVMYEALVGRPPLRGDSLIDTITRHTNETPAPLKEVRPDLSIPEQLEALIMKTLEKEPAMRFTSMHTLKRNLEFVPRFIEEEKKLPPGEAKRKHAVKRKMPDFKTPAIYLAVVLACITGSGALYLTLDETARTQAQMLWLELSEGAHTPRLLEPARSMRDRLVNKGDLRDALGFAQQSASLSKENEPGTMGEARDIYAIGAILTDLHDDTSREYLLKARESFRRIAQANRNSNKNVQNLSKNDSPVLMIKEINRRLGEANEAEAAADLLGELDDAIKADDLLVAEQNLTRLLALKSRLSKAQLAALAEATARLAEQNAVRGPFSQTETFYKQAVELTAEVHGAQSEQLARLQHQFGLFYQKQSQHNSAEEVLLEALAEANASLGARHEFSIQIVRDLAKLYAQMKETKKSQDMLQLAETLKSGEH